VSTQTFCAACRVCGKEWQGLTVSSIENDPTEQRLAGCRTCGTLLIVEMTLTRGELMEHRKRLIRVRQLVERGRQASRQRIESRIHELNSSLGTLAAQDPRRESIQYTISKLMEQYALTRQGDESEQMTARIDQLLRRARKAPEERDPPLCLECAQPVEMLDAVSGLELDCPSCGSQNGVRLRVAE
jgi:DNA-directed RNA polymerase subunit RPC12/RpoP